MSALREVAVYDTTPGADNVFGPPEGWEGSGKDYQELMRGRYGSGPSRGEMLTASAYTSSNFSVFVGPYAEAAATVVRALAKKQRKNPDAVCVPFEGGDRG